MSVPRQALELTSPCPAMDLQLLLLLLLGLAGKVQKGLVLLWMLHSHVEIPGVTMPVG